MKFLFKFYNNLLLTISNNLCRFIDSTLLLYNKLVLPTYKYPTNYSINRLILKFFLSFFSDFLLWNYVLTGTLYRSNNYQNNINYLSKNTVSTRSNIGLMGTESVHLIQPLLHSTNHLSMSLRLLYSEIFLEVQTLVYKSFSFSWYYINGFVFILFIDACLTDDEPLWEPIEWSLVQTWILFIFAFAWIAENLIVSRYGSYAGRDKRVWMAWYKSFWLIEGYYIINYGVTVILVMVPFYFEVNYNLSFVYSWWDWFSKTFFYKFTLLYTIVLFLAFWLQVNLRWAGFKKILFLVTLINLVLGYLIYTHFIIIFFGYFTDPLWYQKTRFVDYIQLSHEPAKWGWGSAKKDHFTYHGVKTVLWFKNDGPFATAFLFCQIFFFICLFCLFAYWIVLFRRILSLSEVPITYTTYCVSSLKQFFFFFCFFYIFILLSFLANYWRFPIEYLFMLECRSWYTNLFQIIKDYPSLLV